MKSPVKVEFKNGRVNSSKFKAQFHEKPHMVPREQVEELTGIQPGAVYVRLEYRQGSLYGWTCL